MKTKVAVLFAAFLSANVALELNAQGYIAFNNLPPANGLVYLASDIPGGLLLNQDVNFELFVGASPFNKQSIHKWLVSDGSASGINVGPGQFADPSDSVFEIPGVRLGGTAYVELWAWIGDFTTFQAALRVGAAGTTAFPNPTGTFDSAPGLTGMQSFVIGIPEPSVLVLAGAGVIALLACRRRRVP